MKHEKSLQSFAASYRWRNYLAVFAYNTGVLISYNPLEEPSAGLSGICKNGMKLVFSLALVLFSFAGMSLAQSSPLWLRYPAISPYGQTLLFEYKGDIWSV